MNGRSGLIPVLITVVALAVIAGCLNEPEIDERWTKLEFLAADPTPGALAPAGQAVDVTVTGRITYREILTGFVVAEVRYSDSISPLDAALNPALHTLYEAQTVDRILANSVTAGRATRAVTGFDHLMQDFTLSFTAQGWPDSVAGSGLFLVFYMGEGEEIELQDGTDSLVVTPFVSTDYEVLHTGYALNIQPPGGGSVP